MRPWLFLVTVFIIGLISMFSQLVVLRELALIFAGNEIFLGLSLAACVGGTAFGAGWIFPRWARSWLNDAVSAMTNPAWLNTLLLPGSILLCRSARLWLHLPAGSEPGMGSLLLALAVTVLPLAASGGLWYAGLLSAAARNQTWKKDSAGKFFAWETLGAGMAGGAFTYWLAFHWQPLTFSLWLFVVICGLALMARAANNSRVHPGWMLAVVLLVLALAYAGSFPERFSQGWQQIPGTRLASAFTPQGHASLYRQQELYSAYYSGSLVYSVPEPDAAEPAALLPLLLVDRPGEVAVFGSNPELPAVLLAQPQVGQITVFDEDPQAQAVWRDALPEKWRGIYSRSRVACRWGDGRRFLRQDRRQYRIIILYLPAPNTLRLNRYYTLEFIRLLRTHLTPDGILEYSLPYSPNRLTQPETAWLGTLWRMLQNEFPHTLLLPGERLYLLASPQRKIDALTPVDLSNRLRAHPMHTSVLRPERLPVLLDAGRARDLRQRLQKTRPQINTDHHPRSVGWQSILWLDQHRGADVLIAGLLLAALAALLGRRLWQHPIKPELLLLGAAGGAGLSLEMLVITAFQSARGNLWQELGLLFAALMLGMAGGGLGIGCFKIRNRAWPLAALLLALLCLSARPVIFLTLGNLPLTLVWLVLGGCCVGVLYAQLGGQGDEQQAIAGWAADLTGSMAGAFLTGMLLLPWLGDLAGAIVAAVLIFTAVPLWWQKTAR